MASELDRLTRKRGVIKGRLTRFWNYVDQLRTADSIDRNLLQSKLSKVDEILSDFNNLNIEMAVLLDDTDALEIESQDFEDKFFEAHSLAHSLLASTNSNTEPSANSSSVQQNVNVNKSNRVSKPAINLPTFDGSFDKWYHFRDLFNSMIDSDTSLSNIEKLHYLNVCLKGEAANIVNSVTISGDNYSLAWDILNERFENKQLIVHSHIHALFSLNNIKRDSYKTLRELLDNLNWHLRSLEQLELPTKQWDALIIYIVCTKLDASTKREWDATTSDDVHKLPTLVELITFLNKKCRQLEKSNAMPDNNISKTAVVSKIKMSSLVSANDPHCYYCNQSHFISHCDAFLKLSTNKRFDEIKNKHLCINCLGKGHHIAACKSKYSCKHCRKRHHSLLHIEKIVNPRMNHDEVLPSTSDSKTIVAHASAKNQILLSTAVIRVIDASGSWHDCRAILDSGSQSNFVTTSFFKTLNLPSTSIHSTIVGINQAHVNLNERADIRIRSRCTAFEIILNCLVIDKITENMPTFSFDASLLNIPSNIKLADPAFNIEGKIDMLIGASFFWQLLCMGQIKLGENKPILHKTRLGWILSGQLDPSQYSNRINSFCNLSLNVEDNLIERFWLIEECNPKRNWSIQEQLCESHFNNTTKRDASGRFIVRIPFKTEKTALGGSRHIALRRFYALEKRLSQNLKLKSDYVDFMTEYEKLGHMKSICETGIENESQIYYLPHHSVLKETSTTTKTRVVFDGSTKTTTGVSLNDIQMVGPVIQDDIFSLLLRFRQYRYVLTADIEKMYRQILLSESDKKYHRIFWRSDSSQSLQCYELQTVTYGTASASYLATRCIQQLALDFCSQYPETCNVIKRDFYVDDLLTGANSLSELKKVQSELIHILSSAGFNLREWLSNSIDFENSSTCRQLQLGDNSEYRTLGIVWNASLDLFKYEIAQLSYSKHITKRTVLSTTAKIFDPLGLLGPVIVVAKLLMQKLWLCKLSWDEPIPPDLHYEWIKFLDNISNSAAISIPRFSFQVNARIIECHGFADASERAYGACIYVRCTDSSCNSTVNLLCAKSRVAPLSKITLPRLELCAAVLLANLIVKVRESLNIQFNQYYFWSDSTIVLSWIKSDASRWHTFVANRISKIQSITNPKQWFHVRSHENPADLLSRGTTPTGLANSTLWWLGPSWLTLDSKEWPIKSACISYPEELPELRKSALTSNVINCDLFERYSSFNKLRRVTAWMLRFTKNCRKKVMDRQHGPLTVAELEISLMSLVKVVQRQAFMPDIQKIKASRINYKGNLLSLHPFLDENNILRVGGRIKESNFAFDKKHPIILPKNHAFTDIIINYEHVRLLHCGAQTLLGSLRDRFWPISARNTIKRLIRNCVTCFKSNPSQPQYLMGNLPSCRINPAQTFQNCGIDYAGPYILRNKIGRGYKTYKGYICLFICMVTKAIHLELVSALSTEAFLDTFKRFISRRGKPQSLYSDNGSNFIGADRELRELSRCATSNTVQEFSANEGISWHFMPPRSPHFGGLWEAGIKSAKIHLKRVLGNASLTFESFYTVLTQVEAVLNSRPISPLSTDPNDLNPLTPGHFLIGRSLQALPEPSVVNISENRLSRYQKLQKLVQHYWTRWSKEYIGELQTRCRWKQDGGSLLHVGAMVIIREENQPPCHWKLGRISEMHPGNDNIVRVVTIKTAQGIVKRSVTKICVLPIKYG